MSSDVKFRKLAQDAASTKARPGDAREAVAAVVNRDEALAITQGLTDAERDLVASIVDFQIEGLGDGSGG